MSDDFQAVARILITIANPANLRSQRRPGDLDGDFDKWFDGGALKVVTGWTEYHFANGARAVVPTTPRPRVDITLPEGSYVSVAWGERPAWDPRAV